MFNVDNEMIKKANDSFETMCSLNQEFTFEDTKKEFSIRNIEFNKEKMHALKLINEDNIYTNLALLLSDQCPCSINVAIFQGDNELIFKKRKDFSGSLLKQMNEVYEFIDFYNETRASFSKLLRIDTRNYPESSIRESLINMLTHRDYSFSASAFIRMFSNRIEFVSMGGLLPGVELEDIMTGLSICRNQNLANVFYRLELIETYGTGIKKIMNPYKDLEVRPTIETTKNTFKVILPNINAKNN